MLVPVVAVKLPFAIVTFPVESTESRNVLAVANDKVFAADKYIPFVGTTLEVGEKLLEVVVPVTVKDPVAFKSPEELIVSLAALAVEKESVLAEGKYIPFVGIVLPVGTKLVALKLAPTVRPPVMFTFPVGSMVNRTPLFVAIDTVLAAERYIPFVGTVLPVGTKLVALKLEPMVRPPVIVTSPVALTENLTALFVAIDTVLAADRYRPFVGATDPVGTKDVPVNLPVATRFPEHDRLPDVSDTSAAMPLAAKPNEPVEGL